VSKIGIKIYETENGLKIVDFMKRKGPAHHYMEFFNIFKGVFEDTVEEKAK